MPVILTQHFSPNDRIYEDVEFALYHFPRQYFSRVRTGERFIYYRPLGKSALRADSKTYFGYGELGEVFIDWKRLDHRFVDVRRSQIFARAVPLRDSEGSFYETESTQPPQFQAAVREISEIAYWRILAASGTKSTELSLLPSIDDIIQMPPIPVASLSNGPPKDPFREIEEIPPGAGYVPHGDQRVSLQEAAALQERARKDHQQVLRDIQSAVFRLGGVTLYNNNVDLFAKVGENRFLIEAKSINNMRAVVDRTRYGVGQLHDYAYRYKAELTGAQSVLAFGRAPDASASWIGAFLDHERIAFVTASELSVVPLNETAKTLPFVTR